MLYETIKIADKEYKCRLNAKACVELEKRLGCNPLNILMVEDNMPTLSNLLLVFHASLQEYQHGITLDDTYELFDKYCEEGGDLAKFVNIIVDIFKAAGFIPKELDTTTKN